MVSHMRGNNTRPCSHRSWPRANIHGPPTRWATQWSLTAMAIGSTSGPAHAPQTALQSTRAQRSPPAKRPCQKSLP
eukprot:7838106-Lingulodinium_polyedra.AAC.1